MFRRVFRLTVKLGIIAAIGVGIALVVKKLTQTPELPATPLEPWPPLPDDAGAAVGDPSNGATAPVADEAAPTEG